VGIQRRTSEPVGITNASGEPEIVLEIEGLTLSMAPPAKREPAPNPPGEPPATPTAQV